MSAQEECVAAEVAADAGLIYVSDATPGIGRRKRGSGFSYLRPDGTAVVDFHDCDRSFQRQQAAPALA